MSHRLYYRLQMAALGLRKTANAELAPLGLTASQLGALYAIDSGAHRPKDLARILQVRASAITTLTGRLQRAGVIQIAPDPDDKRSVRLSLTDMGEQSMNDARPALKKLNQMFGEAFDEGELDTIVRFLDMAAGLESTRETESGHTRGEQ